MGVEAAGSGGDGGADGASASPEVTGSGGDGGADGGEQDSEHDCRVIDQVHHFSCFHPSRSSCCGP